MREIAFDTETTGLDPKSGHRIVEIGCVEMIGRVRTGKHFHTYLNPERDMPPEAERIHGLSSTFLSDKPVFKLVAPELLAFIGDAPLVIHNAGFDMKFINHELGLTGRSALGFERVVDTLPMARGKYPGQPASLDALCRRFGIDLSARDKHGALLDAELLAEVYLELTGGRQTFLDLAAGKKEETNEITQAVKADIVCRAFPASTEEKGRHKAFLKQLKEPLWEKLAEEA